jgi:hypothetical protein
VDNPPLIKNTTKLLKSKNFSPTIPIKDVKASHGIINIGSIGPSKSKISPKINKKIEMTVHPIKTYK